MDILFDKKVSAIELVESIEKGLSFSTFERIVKQYRFAIQDLATIIGISQRTLARRKAEKKLNRFESDRLVSVARLLAQTFELFENDKTKAMQ